MSSDYRPTRSDVRTVVRSAEQAVAALSAIAMSLTVLADALAVLPADTPPAEDEPPAASQ
jgi:hypothetical protein